MLPDWMTAPEEGPSVLTDVQRDMVLKEFNAIPRAIHLGPVGSEKCPPRSPFASDQPA